MEPAISYLEQSESPPSRDKWPIRGEELRRKIRQKELELDTISKKNQSIKMQLSGMDRQNSITQLRDVPTHQKPSKMSDDYFQPDTSHFTAQQSSVKKQEHTEEGQLKRRLTLVSNELQRVLNERQQLQDQCLNVESNIHRYTNQLRLQEQSKSGDQQKLEHEISSSKQHQQILKQQIEQVTQQQDHIVSTLQEQQFKNQNSGLAEVQQQLMFKIALIKGLERDNYDQQQIQEALETQIQQKERQLDLELRKLTQLSKQTQQVHIECHQFQGKTEQLKATYEETVYEIDSEQNMIIESNKYQLKLMASKDIWFTLSRFVATRQQECLADVKHYCAFDKRCQMVLDQFKMQLESVGRQRMRQYLLVWFQNCFETIKTQTQVETCLSQHRKQKIIGNVLNKWTNKLYANQQQYAVKLESAKQMYWIKAQDVKKEVLRYYMIWKSLTQFNKLQLVKLQRLVLNHRRKQLMMNFQAFRVIAVQEGLQVRHLIRIKAHCYQQYLHRLWESLRQQCLVQKDKRLNRMKHIFKCLQDGIRYHKHFKKSSKQAEKLRSLCVMHTLQTCFAQLRLHKEQSKSALMMSKCQQLPNQDYYRIVGQLSAKQLKLQRIRAFSCLKTLGLKQVNSYFKQWVAIKEDYSCRMLGLQRLLRYQGTRLKHTAMQVWMCNANLKSKQQLAVCLTSLNQDNIELTQLCIQEQTKIQNDQDNQAVLIKQVSRRIVYKWVLRTIHDAMRHWQTRLSEYKAKQTQASFIVKRTASNYLKRMFYKWHLVCKTQQQSEKSESRADYYLQLRQDRLIRTVYKAINIFNAKNTNARRSLLRVINQNEYLAKQHVLNTWKYSNMKHQVLIAQQQQNGETDLFSVCNLELGSVVKTQTEHSQQNSLLRTELLEQGQRVLSNYFQRFYYSKAQRGFQRWHQCIQFLKHRDQYLLRCVDHQRKARFYVFKAALQNWIGKSKAASLKQQIKHTGWQIDEVTQDQQVTRSLHLTKEQDIQSQLVDMQKVDVKPVVVLRSRLIQQIVAKQQRNNYTSLLRFIFTNWRMHTKRTVQFVRKISQALTKSMLQNGFTNVARFSRDKLTTRLQNRVLEGMVRMKKKKMLQSVISTLLTYFYAQNNSNCAGLKATQLQSVREFQEFFVNSKTFQLKQAHKIKKRIDLVNMWKAWRNVSRWQASVRQATIKFQSNISNKMTIRSLLKWSNRSKVTLKLRLKTQQIKDIDQFVYQRNYFDRLRIKTQRERNLFMLLANAASKYDFAQKERAFRLIENGYKHEKQVVAKQKTKVAFDLFYKLEFLMHKRKVQILSDLRSWGKSLKSISSVLRRVRLFQGRHLRHVFNIWKQKTVEQKVVIDVEEHGPVVNQPFEIHMQLKTYEAFLKDEKYTSAEIQDIKEETKAKVQDRMLKVIRRLQHQEDLLSTKPWVFERWKEYVKMRKLVRYLLDKIIYKMRPKTNLMYKAFGIWRQLTAKDSITLKRITLKQLTIKAREAQIKAQELKVYLQQSSELKQQLTIQRDELVEKYIGAQKLALALGRDNKQKGMWHSMSRLQTSMHNREHHGYQQILESNLSMIKQLKAKITDYEFENQQVATENEELRQFSLQGIKLAKNAKELQEQRVMLSVDLADQSQYIKNLLSQNQKLMSQLNCF